jgi:signal transduction histidine kinase
MRQARNIRRTVLVGMTLLTMLSTSVLGYLWIWQEYATFRNQAENIRTELTESRKALTRSRVDNAVEYIEFKRLQTERRTREVIRTRTEEAHALATHIFEQYRQKLALDEIKDLVREALRPIRYDNGRGYYFATALDGVEQLFADRPEMEGTNLLDMQDTRGAYVIRDMIELVRTRGEGYYTYTWTKPDSPGRDFLKISHVKHFEPFDWFIGTGEYLDDVEENLKREALEWVGDIRYDDGGYIFVGTWEGLSLSGPMVGRNMLDTVDPDGVSVVRELIATARSGGGFVSYIMPGFEGYRSAPKVSYVAAVRDWQWYVGTGVYLDDVERTIAAARAGLATRVKYSVVKILAIMAALLISSYFISRGIAQGIDSQFEVFSDFFDKAARDSVEVDAGSLKFAEFRDLAEAANRMVTERLRAEEEKAELTDRLLHAQKMEAGGRLAGGVAHDFNNLLQVVSGYAEMTLRSLPESDSRRQNLTEVLGAAARAASLTRQLLTFSRRDPFRPACIDLPDLVSRTADMLRRVIGADIELIVRHRARHAYVDADVSQVELILMNLAINARDAMPDGGTITIETAPVRCPNAPAFASPLAECVLLSVSDTGVGIPPDIRPHLFEPFFTTKDSKVGTGLGLATVYAVVKRHGGVIDFESEPGRGTTFRIHFQESAKPPSTRVAEAGPPAALAGTETVLLAEDNEAVRRFTKGVLESAGYRTIVARDGGGSRQDGKAARRRDPPRGSGCGHARRQREVRLRHPRARGARRAGAFHERIQLFLPRGDGARTRRLSPPPQAVWGRPAAAHRP